MSSTSVSRRVVKGIEMIKGKFVTLEGCEGAGKSAQLRLLKAFLDENGIDYVSTREPGGTPAAEDIRAIILDVKNSDMPAECEALLYAAARAEHVKNKILPALNDGKLVLCDRYIDSSLAYQVYARGLDYEFVYGINHYAVENCMPDLTLFLDISPEKAFARKGGVDTADRLEMEGAQFHQKVYEGYLKLAERFPQRFIRVRCDGTKFETSERIIGILRDYNILPEAKKD